MTGTASSLGLFVYTTTPTQEMARTIARSVVEEQLAACANILPGMESVYRWQGAVQQESECVVILKTTQEAYPALEARIKALHSYDVPCIVALELAEAEPHFAAWLKGQIKL